MNKQSVSYTLLYIIGLVLIVGTALAFTSQALSERQQQNADADKMKQILAAVHIVPAKGDITSDFHKYIVEEVTVDETGNILENIDAFNVNVAEQVRLEPSQRQLPVYICRLDDNSLKYILPAYGAGLWGPIWGYVALDDNGSTIYGAYFAHQGETPGLGAEIEKPAFSNQFENKNLFKDGRFMPVAVVKKGQKPSGDEDYVDGVSGGTITSKGVGAMISNSIAPYENYLKTLTGK